METKQEIIVNECEETSITRGYNLSITYKGEEREVGITTEEQMNIGCWEVSNIEFLDNCEKLTDDEKSEIKEWVEENSDSWLK